MGASASRSTATSSSTTRSWNGSTRAPTNGHRDRTRRPARRPDLQPTSGRAHRCERALQKPALGTPHHDRRRHERGRDHLHLGQRLRSPAAATPGARHPAPAADPRRRHDPPPLPPGGPWGRMSTQAIQTALAELDAPASTWTDGPASAITSRDQRSTGASSSIGSTLLSLRPRVPLAVTASVAGSANTCRIRSTPSCLRTLPSVLGHARAHAPAAWVSEMQLPNRSVSRWAWTIKPDET